MSAGSKIILTTGGTGGHIFPALAVAEALRRQEPAVELLFVGGLYGPEKELAAKAGLDFVGLDVRGLQGRGLKSVPAAWAMLSAVLKARGIIKNFRPDVVAGFGGYAAFATVYAAKTKGVPTLIHEQNAIPGTANRMLGKHADRICLSVPDAQNIFMKTKCIITGNPVREDIGLADRGSRGNGKTAPTLLIMGGSQGATAINDLVISLLPDLSASGIRQLHQTGRSDFERVRAAYLKKGYPEQEISATVLPFIDNVAEVLNRADLVLGRAGATSLAELAVAGLPAILVPFPYAIHDHQTANAKVFHDAGAAILVNERDLPETDMSGLIRDLLGDPDRLAAMSAAMTRMAHPDAAARVAEQILALRSKSE